MADVVSKTDATVFALSVHTPDYPSGSWLINPAGLATLIAGSVPNKYWKHNGGVTDILEMTAGEKTDVDNAVPNAERVCAANDATPDVTGLTQILSANTGATSVTTFDGGVDGQVLNYRIGDALTTLVDGATLDLIFGHPLNAQQGEIWTFQKIDTVWRLRHMPFRATHTFQFGGEIASGDVTEKALVWGGTPTTAVVAKGNLSALTPKMVNDALIMYASLVPWTAGGGDTLDQWKIIKNALAFHDSGTGAALGNGGNEPIPYGTISNNPIAGQGAGWQVWVKKAGTANAMQVAAAFQIMDNELR